MKGQSFTRHTRNTFQSYKNKSGMKPRVQKVKVVKAEIEGGNLTVLEKKSFFNRITGLFRRVNKRTGSFYEPVIHRADPMKRKLRKIARRSRRYNLRTA